MSSEIQELRQAADHWLEQLQRRHPQAEATLDKIEGQAQDIYYNSHNSMHDLSTDDWTALSWFTEDLPDLVRRACNGHRSPVHQYSPPVQSTRSWQPQSDNGADPDILAELDRAQRIVRGCKKKNLEPLQALKLLIDTHPWRWQLVRRRKARKENA